MLCNLFFILVTKTHNYTNSLAKMETIVVSKSFAYEKYHNHFTAFT